MKSYRYYSIIRFTLSCLFLGIFLAGCLGSGGKRVVTQYYLIDAIAYEPLLPKQAEPLAIEIIDLHIPQYLEKFQIATRAGENRLKFSETHQWGENLRKNLMRTLSINLSDLLATKDIGTPLKRSSSVPDIRAQVYIEQFELGVDRKVKLSARWQISDLESTEPLAIHSEVFVSPAIEGNDYDQIVTLMKQLYGELSVKISESIIAEMTQ